MFVNMSHIICVGWVLPSLSSLHICKLDVLLRAKHAIYWLRKWCSVFMRNRIGKAGVCLPCKIKRRLSASGRPSLFFQALAGLLQG